MEMLFSLAAGLAVTAALAMSLRGYAERAEVRRNAAAAVLEITAFMNRPGTREERICNGDAACPPRDLDGVPGGRVTPACRVDGSDPDLTVDGRRRGETPGTYARAFTDGSRRCAPATADGSNAAGIAAVPAVTWTAAAPPLPLRCPNGTGTRALMYGLWIPTDGMDQSFELENRLLEALETLDRFEGVDLHTVREPTGLDVRTARTNGGLLLCL